MEKESNTTSSTDPEEINDPGTELADSMVTEAECPNPDVCGCKHEPLKLTPEGEAEAATVTKEEYPDLGGPPMLPEKLTRKQIGALRRAHITVTLGSVIKCGHKAKFGPTKTPGNNCVHCWEAFFQTAVDLEALHTLVTAEGPKGMEKKYGTKFMRNFHGFLATELMRSPALPPSTEGFNIPNLEESIPHEHHREEVHEVTA